MTQSCPPQPQVSVIVPVYNQERYLEECISSIRRQTLAEWECLIINDGSSDSSGEIARRFSEADSRIRYFEQENGGVSSARNLGMQRASGRYLCFVDGDDFIDAAFLKHLLDASDRGASDLTVAGKLFCDRFPPDKIPALPTCGIFLRREFPLKNNLEFPEGIHPCEDGLFSHFALALAEKISFCPEAVYHYRQHEQGNHHQIRKRTADILDMVPRWLSLIEEFYEQRQLWTRKAGHLVRFVEHEPFELRLLDMPFSHGEQEMLYGIIRDFLKAHCTDAECRRESLHLPFRLLLKSTSFSDFGRRLRKAGRNTGILWKLLPFCPVPSWRRNGREILHRLPFGQTWVRRRSGKIHRLLEKRRKRRKERMLARWRTLAAPPHYREETDWITAIHSEKGQARILLIGDSVMRHLWRPLASELQEDIDLFSSTLIPGDPDYLPTLAGYFPSAGYEAVIVSFGSHVTNKVSAISVDDFRKNYMAFVSQLSKRCRFLILATSTSIMDGPDGTLNEEKEKTLAAFNAIVREAASSARRGSFRPPWLHAGAQIYRSLPFLPSGPRVPGRENSRTAPAPSLRPAGTAKGTGMSENPPRTMKRTNERKPPNYFPYGEKRLPPAKIPAPAFKDFKFPPFFKLQTSLFRPERSLHALSLPGLFLPAAPSSRPFP